MATPVTYQKIQTTKGMLRVPIYKVSDVKDSSLRIYTGKGIGCYDLVLPSDATPLRVMTAKGIRGIRTI
ncbi:hypothetical protein [Paenisporosarcina sp.]|uniref:hypothetical protein n=1 Tax=Paenisporosarcina sp. TaxID=1932001 RepID=UPI003C714F67